jgi:beta-carotene 3-hydroxylase
MQNHIAIAGRSCPHPQEGSGWYQACQGQAPGFFSAPGHDPFCSGTGISIYGLIYLLVHQVFIHRRIKVFNKLFNHVYLMAIYPAYPGHEASSLKNQTGTAGLLGVPAKYLTLAQRSNKHL